MPLRGSCQCGGIRFEVPDDFEPRSFCHCATCKKLSGGVGTANGRVRSDDVEIVEGMELLRTYQPEEGSAKTFCLPRIMPPITSARSSRSVVHLASGLPDCTCVILSAVFSDIADP